MSQKLKQVVKMLRHLSPDQKLVVVTLLDCPRTKHLVKSDNTDFGIHLLVWRDDSVTGDDQMLYMVSPGDGHQRFNEMRRRQIPLVGRNENILNALHDELTAMVYANLQDELPSVEGKPNDSAVQQRLQEVLAEA